MLNFKWLYIPTGLEPDLLSFLPQPVIALLLLFPITENYERHRSLEAEVLKRKEQEISANVFFIHQTISNACGTIGLLHSLANNEYTLGMCSISLVKETCLMSLLTYASFMFRGGTDKTLCWKGERLGPLREGKASWTRHGYRKCLRYLCSQWTDGGGLLFCFVCLYWNVSEPLTPFRLHP